MIFVHHPAMLQAVLLAFVVCFHQAKLEDTEEQPSTAVPELIGTEHKLEVDEGNTFRLKCQYKDLGSKATVMWRKNQSYITVGTIVMPAGPIASRITILKDQSVEVVNSSRDDAGVYTCELGVKTENKLQQHHTLHVNYPAKITKVNPRNGVSIPVGTDVKLECESEGFPEPTIRWTLQDSDNVSHGELLNNGRTLYIPKIMPNHAGTYKCITQNEGFDTTDEQHINVSVLFPPQVATDPAENNVSVLMHKSVTLKCNVLQANPAPTIKWFFNGTLMPITTSEYTIEETKLADKGIYKCHVSNSLGEPFENAFTLSVIYNEHQNVAEEEPSRGTTNSHLQLASLLTIILTFSRVFW